MGDILYDTIFEVFDEDRDEETVMPPTEPSAAAPPPPKPLRSASYQDLVVVEGVVVAVPGPRFPDLVTMNTDKRSAAPPSRRTSKLGSFTQLMKPLPLPRLPGEKRGKKKEDRGDNVGAQSVSEEGGAVTKWTAFNFDFGPQLSVSNEMKSQRDLAAAARSLMKTKKQPPPQPPAHPPPQPQPPPKPPLAHHPEATETEALLGDGVREFLESVSSCHDKLAEYNRSVMNTELWLACKTATSNTDH